MKRTLVRRGAVGLALGALALTGMATTPAPASAALEFASVYSAGSFNGTQDQCTATADSPDPASVPWVDNGVAVTSQASKTGTITKNDNPADKSTATTSGSATISSSPLGTGAPATITVSGSAAATMTPAAGTACSPGANGSASAYGGFTLPAPTWVTINGNANGNGDAEFRVESEDGMVSLNPGGSRSSGSVTALLPAGDVYVSFRVDAYASSSTRSRSVTAGFTVTLEPVGNGSAVAGKGKSYVELGARDCATGAVAVTVNKKAVKKAKVVQIKVNGKKKGKKFQGKKLKKRTVAVAAPATSDARIGATITLKSGKKVKATRTYRSC